MPDPSAAGQKRERVWRDSQEEDQNQSAPSELPKWAQPQVKRKKVAKPVASDSDDDSSAAEDSEGEADAPGAEAESTFDAILRTTAKLTKYRGGARLPPTELAFGFRSDANVASHSVVAPSCIRFHPDVDSNLILVSAPDNHVKLFKLGPKRNELFQSLHLKDMQPLKCLFDPSGSTIFVSGGKSACYIIDTATYQYRRVTSFVRNHQLEKNLPTFGISPDGAYLPFINPTGHCFLVARQTFSLVATLKMGERLHDVAFDPDNTNYMYLCGGGKVYTWDLRNTQEPLSVLRDEGALDCRRIAIAHSHLAVGSDVGIVNTYAKPVGGCFASSYQPPIKTFKNLTVAIDHLAFNHDGQILFFGSANKKGQHRMANMGSLTVFANYPGTLNEKTCMAFDFSPDSSRFVLGSLECRAIMLKLWHYAKATPQ